MNYTDKILELRSLVPGVDHYIDSGTYMLFRDKETWDSISDQMLLNDCYRVIILELEKLGVLSTVDEEELLSDYYTADGLVRLRLFVDVDKLVPKLIENRAFYDEVLFVLDNEYEENLLSSLLIVYEKHHVGEKEYMEYLERIDGLFFSNSTFARHIEAMLELAVPKANLQDTDKELREKYIEKIAQGRAFFKLAVDAILEEGFPNLDPAKLQHAVDLYDLDKVTGENLNKLTWAVMTDPNSLHPEQQDKQKEIIDAHHKETTHHIEYYDNKRIVPDENQLVELVAHHFEPGSTREQFLADIKEMLEIKYTPLFKNEQDATTIILPEQRGFVNRLVQIILDKLFIVQE